MITYVVVDGVDSLLEVSRQLSVLVRLHRVVVDTMSLLAHIRHDLGFVNDPLGLLRHGRKLLAAVDENGVEASYPINNVHILLLRVHDVFELLDGIELPVLELDLLLEINVKGAHLLKQLEDDLVDVVFLLDNVQCLVPQLLHVISLHAPHLKNVRGDLAHLDRLQLGRLGISCFTRVAGRVTLIVLLALDDVFLVLIELSVKVEKVNALDVDLVDVRGLRIASRHADPVFARQRLEFLAVDARSPVIVVPEHVV